MVSLSPIWLCNPYVYCGEHLTNLIMQPLWWTTLQFRHTFLVKFSPNMFRNSKSPYVTHEWFSWHMQWLYDTTKALSFDCFVFLFVHLEIFQVVVFLLLSTLYSRNFFLLFRVLAARKTFSWVRFASVILLALLDSIFVKQYCSCSFLHNSSGVFHVLNIFHEILPIMC